MNLFIDIEWRSAVDVTKVGLYALAEHPTTQVTVMRWRVDRGPLQGWQRWSGEPIPAGLLGMWADPSVVKVAHNAAAERVVLNAQQGFAVAPVESFDCTAARAAALGLPRSLEGATAALGLAVQKDKAGATVMRKMAKPIKRRLRKGEIRDPTAPAEWVEDAESIRILWDYCGQDVDAECGLFDTLPPLSPTEREIWLLTERMNDRGVRVDDRLLLDVLFMVEDAEADIGRRLAEATGGAADRASDHGAITRWLQSLDADDDIGDEGVGKAALAAMLERTDLSPLVRQVLLLRQEGGKSSTSKYRAMLARMSRDGRVRGTMVYCGAASTGRWSSRGVQLHNLPRPFVLKKASRAYAAIRDLRDGATFSEIDEIHGPALVVASELLRPALTAGDGSVLARGDSKQIEARVTPWLAGAEWKLDAFRAYDAGTGPDTYKVSAAGIYHVSPADIGDEDPRRQIGKVSDLSLGFGGGTGALQAMAKAYGVKIPRFDGTWQDDAPDGTDEWIKRKWRLDNPEVVRSWSDVETAAIQCMQSSKGVVVPAGKLSFRRNSRALAMRLPSGRSLMYWTPRLREVMTPWGKPKTTLIYRAEDSQTHVWREWHAYGGLIFQNPVQAVARDLMAYWLLACAATGLLHPVLTVHDEGINESPLPADEAAALVERIMHSKPAWADGLPVAADSSAAVRYLKG